MTRKSISGLIAVLAIFVTNGAAAEDTEDALKTKLIKALEQIMELQNENTDLRARIKELEDKLDSYGHSSRPGPGGSAVTVQGVGKFELKKCLLNDTKVIAEFVLHPSTDGTVYIYMDSIGYNGSHGIDDEGDKLSVVSGVFSGNKSNRHYMRAKVTDGIPVKGHVVMSGARNDLTHIALVSLGVGPKLRANFRKIEISAE